MFSVVLLVSLMAGESTADFGHKSCYGGCHGCYGGCYGSCYGCCGGCYGSHGYYGSCHGCYGGWSCHGCCGGGVTYYGCGGCCGGCYGGYNGCCGGGVTYHGCGSVCGGGCWGAPYAGYSSGCLGGCGGYASPAYSAPAVIGTPIGAATTVVPGTTVTEVAAAPTDRARLTIKIPEGAKLYVENQLVENVSATKVFRTPVLEAGKTFVYTMRVEAEKDGEKVIGEKQVNVRAGRTEDVDLTSVELKKDTKVAAR